MTMQESSEQSPSGHRILLSGPTGPFPSLVYTNNPPCHDVRGETAPVFLGSAIFSTSVHPCKITPHLLPRCRAPYGGSEVRHEGRYYLLPFDPETMEWVPTDLGHIPTGRTPVQGGYEENGTKLYHAMGSVSGWRVPGKTGEHLHGCHVAFAGAAHFITHGYDILCWK